MTVIDEGVAELFAREKEKRKRQRAAVAALAATADADDVQGFVEALDDVIREWAWTSAFRALRGRSAGPQVRMYFLELWIGDSATLRTEISDDLVLLDALRALLPPYDGPALVVYRGEALLHRRQLGPSWSTDVVVARSHATGLWQTLEGGSAVFRAEAPPAAIISAPRLLSVSRSEEEVVCDRRLLRNVTTIERFDRRPL